MSLAHLQLSCPDGFLWSILQIDIGFRIQAADVLRLPAFSMVGPTLVYPDAHIALAEMR